MATIQIGVSGSTVVSGSKSYTISDSNLASLVSWARSRVSTTSTASDGQVLAGEFDLVMSGFKSAVTKFLKDNAATSASAATTGIDII